MSQQPSPSPSDSLAFDREHLWHPYTSMTEPVDDPLVTGADGVRLRLADGTRAGRRDGVVVVRHPRLPAPAAGRRRPPPARHDEPRDVRRAHSRAGDRARDADWSSSPPKPLQHVFFADSGSVSVEVALKMAVQYQRGHGSARADRACSRCAAATTGTPTGAMSVTDPVNGMHTMFTDVLPQHVFADRPPALGTDVDSLDRLTSASSSHDPSRRARRGHLRTRAPRCRRACTSTTRRA